MWVLSRRKVAAGSAAVGELGGVHLEHARPTESTATATPVRQQRVTLPIYGLGCGGGGALTIERALARTGGVLRAYVNPATETAYVEFDPSRTSTDRLIAVIRDLGFRAGEPSAR